MDDLKANFFNVYLCNVCKSKESFNHSKLCSGCKLVSYCGKNHQKADWGSHKSICKATQEMCRKRGANDLFEIGLKEVDSSSEGISGAMSQMNLQEHPPGPGIKRTLVKVTVRRMMEKHLNRGLEHIEMNMIFFPQHCAVCFTRVNIQKELVCTNCFGVAYCSAEHQNVDDHEKLCSEFQKALDVDLFMQKVNCEYPQTHLIEPEQATNLKLDTCDMKSFIANYVRPGLKLEEEALISIHYTCVLTFAYFINQMPNFTFGKNLIIHIVGAHAKCEGEVLECWENLLHLFPIVHTMTVVHISPSIDGSPIKLELCRNCNKTKKSLNCLFYRQHYHEFFDSSSVIKKPDAIIVFNSGFGDWHPGYDPWRKSLPLFFQYDNVPVILTEVMKREAEKDFERLCTCTVVRDKKVRIVANCQKNPFYNMRPWRCWDDPDHGVRRKNSYVSAFIVDSA